MLHVDDEGAGPPHWWSEEQRAALLETVKPYNVAGIFHGHEHDTPMIYNRGGYDLFKPTAAYLGGFGLARVTDGFMDVALFAGARGLGVLQAGGAVTLDLSAQFIGGGRIGPPLEARIELLRETSRMLFLRGLVVQEATPVIASFTGTLRKSSPPPGMV